MNKIELTETGDALSIKANSRVGKFWEKEKIEEEIRSKLYEFANEMIRAKKLKEGH